jgi:hypothetical protein
MTRVAASRVPSRVETKETVMVTEIAVASQPVLAAGWSLLYLLLGGGIGGAILIFLGLKAIGR